MVLSTVVVHPERPTAQRGPVQGGDHVLGVLLPHFHQAVALPDVDASDPLPVHARLAGHRAQDLAGPQSVPLSRRQKEAHPARRRPGRVALPPRRRWALRPLPVQQEQGRGRHFGPAEAVGQRLHEQVVGRRFGRPGRLVNGVRQLVQGGRNPARTGGARPTEPQSRAGGDLLQVPQLAHRSQRPGGTALRVPDRGGGGGRGRRRRQRGHRSGLGGGRQGRRRFRVFAGREPDGRGFVAGGAAGVAVQRQEVAQVGRLIRRFGEHQHVPRRVVFQQAGRDRQRRFRPASLQDRQVQLPVQGRGRRGPRGGHRGRAPGKAARQRSQLPAEGQAAEDALTLLGKAREEDFEAVGRHRRDHAVPVVEDDRLDSPGLHRAVVEGLEALGRDEEEVGRLGPPPALRQGRDPVAGAFADAREGSGQFGGLPRAAAEDHARGGAGAALEPVHQGRAVGHHRAAARSGPPDQVVAAGDHRDRRRLEGGRPLDPLRGKGRDRLGAKGKVVEGRLGACHRKAPARLRKVPRQGRRTLVRRRRRARTAAR